MSQDNWTPIYSICPDTGLRVCEVYQFLLVREDGVAKNINPIYRTNENWSFGYERNKGYRAVKFKCKPITIHRLVAKAFLPNYDERLQVDHINGNKIDNRLCNIRMVTVRQNAQNRKEHRNGRLVGINHIKKDNAWSSRILINGKRVFLGYYKTQIEAHNAYMQAVEKLEKEMPLV